jgi:tripartite-type tricarboxylate transporter receptor subunit TctC
VGSVGWMTLKGAPPDGYTIGTVSYDILTVEHQNMAPVSWQDFELIGMVTEHATALVVRAEDFESLDEFIAAAEAEPGRLPVSNASTGGVWHQHAVAMERELGIELNHVPYESAAPQVTALLGGETMAAVISLPPVMEYVRSGEMRVLAVMADERVDLVPDVPTFTELGHDVVYGSFRFLAAPPGTPIEIVQVLEQAMYDTFQDPEFIAWAEQGGVGHRWLDRDASIAYMEAISPVIGQLMVDLGLAD